MRRDRRPFLVSAVVSAAVIILAGQFIANRLEQLEQRIASLKDERQHLENERQHLKEHIADLHAANNATGVALRNARDANDTATIALHRLHHESDLARKAQERSLAKWKRVAAGLNQANSTWHSRATAGAAALRSMPPNVAAAPPQQKPPAAAFCVAGQARGFSQPAVWQSIQSNAVRAFGALADVFLVLRHGDGHAHLSDDSSTHTTELRQILGAVRQMRPTRFELLPESLNLTARMASRDGNTTCPYKDWPTSSFRYKFLAAWVTVARAFEMVLEQEASRGARFAFVIKLRPDEQLCHPFPSWQQFTGRYAKSHIATLAGGARHAPNIHDHLFVAVRSLADHAFAAWHEISLCRPAAEYFTKRSCRGLTGRTASEESHIHDPYLFKEVPAECFLSRWLMRGGISYDTFLEPILRRVTVVTWDTPTGQRPLHYGMQISCPVAKAEGVPHK